MASYKKDPNATLDYTFDWTPNLAAIADTIVSVIFTTTAGLTKTSQSHTATTATAFVSGGVVGETEKLSCRITTAGGRTDERTIDLKILER